MAQIEIPLSATNQRCAVELAGKSYRLRAMWNDTAEGGWTLDIGKPDGTPILAGIALVPNTDLLAQHVHLEFGGALIVTSDDAAGEAPTYAGLGTTSRMFFVAAD